jgi:acetolactate synthase-1/2/3 large subunit
MVTCGEKLALLLDAWGIDTAFGIPGTHTIELYRGIPQTRIRHVTPRHEQGAGFMADGYARASGRPAACITVSGPGALNIAAAMGQALADSVPILVISADNNSWERGLGEGRLHETHDLRAAMAEVSRWSHTLARPDELPRVLARAFAIFASARPGPVHLSIPLDVITANADHVPVQTCALPSRPAADLAALREAARLLNESSRPVIAYGGGAVDAGAVAVALAERLDAPVTLTHNAKGLLPPAHPLHVAGSPSYQPIRNLYLDADVILGVGTEFGETDYDFFFNGGFRLGGRVVRIDIDAVQLTRNVLPAVAIQADSRLALDALLPLLERRARDGAARTAAVNAGLRALDHPGHQRFLDTVQAALPDAIVIGDSTQPAYFAAHQYHATAPRRFASAATGYGTLGYALPAALGAKLARPDLPVVALHGDGGLQFTLNELSSGVEAGLGVALVVWNNRRYEMIAQNFVAAGMRPIACDIHTPDFLALAAAYGCRAVRVRDRAGLASALREAAAARVPTLIEADERDFLDAGG